MKGLINELYLDDLKKKTIRGLEEQKSRGYTAGEKVYGYYTKPSGKLIVNKKGQQKYDGMVHKINPDESEVVKKIFKEFINGKSISKIVEDLNRDKIPTKKGYSGGWNTSTVSRILKNEKYMGLWIWRKWKNVRDPMTGKMKKISRPKKEQLRIFKEDLIVIDKEIWGKAQKRWSCIKGTFPIRKKSKNSNIKQKSYVYANPPHLLAGLMKYSKCGGAIVLLSFQKQNKFTSPPKEWINHKLEELRDTLNQNTVNSSLALKELLGNISLEPVTDKKSDFYYIVSNRDIKFKPYYIAHTKIQTLALLDDKYKGSNWLHWRREWDSNPRYCC